MNFLTLVTEVIQGCKVEGLGVKMAGSGPLRTIWYEEGFIILSSSDKQYAPSRLAVLVSPLDVKDGELHPRLNQ